MVLRRMDPAINFESGYNLETYKYCLPPNIKIRYIIMDERLGNPARYRQAGGR